MCLTKFAAKNIDFLFQLFQEGSLKPWDDLKIEYNLTNETCFQWLLLKHGNFSELLTQDHYIIKGAQILTLEKLSSKELYSILTTKFTNKPSSNV